jgi:hypothetical protein
MKPGDLYQAQNTFYFPKGFILCNKGSIIMILEIHEEHCVVLKNEEKMGIDLNQINDPKCWRLIS